MRSAALLITIALAAPAAAQTPAAPPKIELPYTQFTLANGLRVILHEDHSVPMVTVNMWYHVGSAREREKRTGFAHLFEHLMFMGSGHVKPGEFDEWLEAAGGDNNGSTETDRTNYWINVPANSLELALFLESDRMGYLLDTVTPKTVDAQHDVGENEPRPWVENRPYRTAEEVTGGAAPGWGKRSHFGAGGAGLDLVADVLAGGKNSRLYKRLVYDMQIAQDVSASQASAQLSSSFQIIATPRPGHTVAELQKVIDEEIQKLQRETPTSHELERSVNQIESSFYNRMERVGGFGGKADQLNAYYTYTGDPDWFNEDLARYRALSVTDISAAAAQFLPLDKRVELIVEPEKRP